MTVINGRPCYAPDLARESPGFKAEHFAELAALEDGHFWFRARNKLIIHVLRRHFPQAQNMLEIGCGTGYVLRGVAQHFPQLRMSGSEIFLEGLSFAARRVPRADLFQMDAQQIPFVDEFDLVGAFDVIEHIADDERVLREIHRALKPGGGALFTVPQHPGLWSIQDVHACHVRRYRRHELANKLRSAGFRIVFSTSFVSLLLPILATSRWRQRHAGGEHEMTGEFKLPAAINTALYGVLRLEHWLIAMGLRFPIGGTRLIAAVRLDG
ncbi:class I SAM-dependent methyltransferase [Rhodanobacter sp. Si-c]|uniref:Class I SAM-dependent methyltransferase n=1 Tax=Rhodanobacter lycopersici TaxID=3162487 RepID=A0ABV3QC58_9GAMM